MDRERQKLGYALGLTFHKKGGYVDNVVKAMDNIDDKYNILLTIIEWFNKE